MTGHDLASLAASGLVEEFEAAWLEALEEPADADEFLQALSALPGEHRGGAAAPLLALLLEAYQQRDRHLDVIVVARELHPHRQSRVDLREAVRKSLDGLYTGEEWYELFSGQSGIKEDGPLIEALDRFEALRGLLPGRVVYHRSGWGEGLVIEVDLSDQSFAVAFREDGLTRNMPFSTGLDVLTPLAPTDLRARLLTELEQLQAEAAETPSHLVRAVAKLHKGRATVKEVKKWLAGTVIEEKSWSGWWKKCKTAAVHDPWLAVDNPSRPVFVLRQRALSAEDELRAAMQRARGLAALLEVVGGPLSLDPNEDIKKQMLDRLAEVLESGSGEPHDQLEAALLLWRHEAWTEERTVELFTQLLDGGADFIDLCCKLSNNGARRSALDAFVRARPQLWSDAVIGNLARLPIPLLDLVADRLVEGGRAEALANRFHIFLLSPSRQPLTVLRLARRAVEGLFKDIEGAPSVPEVVMGLLHLAETQATRASRGDKPAKEVMKQLIEVLTTRKGGLVKRFATEGTRLDLEQAMSVMARCRSFPDEISGALTKAVHERDPDLVPRDEVPFWETNGIFCSHAGVLARQEEYRILLEDKIPENSETIGRAASYGDLSENFEWTAAIEQQRQLTEKAAAMEAELKLAQVIEEQELTDDVVAPGMRVTFRQDGESRTITILGPWDHGEGIVSYRAPMAAGMLGAGVGDSAMLELPQGNSEVVIEAIEKAV